MLHLICLLALFILNLVPLISAEAVDLGDPYGQAILIDEIDCSAAPDPEQFLEYPEQASKIEQILGQNARVLPNDKDTCSYMAYRLGRGKGLKAGAAYLICVVYPEDQARSMYILNRGNETGMGFATGESVADCLTGRYVNNSPESINYPLAQQYREWQSYFHLHDRFPAFKSIRGRTERTEKPADGFWLVIAQHKRDNAPMSKGAAISRIRLYEVPHCSNVQINYPAEGLPRRYVFCREEMADGVVSVPHGADEPQFRGLDNPINWFEYKAQYMKFIGMNTFTKDLLEFGHNQGWAASPTDNSWYVQSSTPDRWQRMLNMLKKYDLSVLPLYEYGGSTGADAYGKVKDMVNLQGNPEYTHIKWLEKNSHVDITDPRALEDLKKVLQITILDQKENANFIGAWLRPRPMQMPMSFSDAALARYVADTKHETVTREILSANKAELDAYYTWWFQKRADFLYAISDFLRDGLDIESTILFTTDATEPGCALPQKSLVTDNVNKWATILNERNIKCNLLDYTSTVAQNLYGQACTSPRGTWGKHEVHHASPWSDPHNFKAKTGVALSHTIHRLYSCSNAESFENFRSASGLAVVRHHSLNENEMEEQLGYFVCDVERSGPHSMLNEARSLAYGDPRFFGYLISNTLSNGFPQYKRAFNAAFLALPAIPSQVLSNVANDPEIIVRSYPTEKHGTYYAIINTSLEAKSQIKITLPKGELRNLVSGDLLSSDGSFSSEFYSGQVISLHTP